MDKGFKTAWREFRDYAKSDKTTVRRLLLSVISLFIVLVMFITMTFSWFTTKVSTVEANNFTLDCGKGLRVNDSGTSQMSFSQDEDRYIIPASSVDGRNLFFSTDGSDFSSVTENMTFRSANVGDKNQNYIQIDFTLTAQQSHTALYINDEKTSIKVSNGTEWSTSQAAPLRAALWSSTEQEGVPNTPIVFNSTNSTVRTAAVADVDRSTGAFIANGRQVAHSFSEYSFGGTPVATLAKGVETKFSYIIWLEGTDVKCTDKIMNRNIEIKLAFTTSWDKTQTIRFRDDTSASWVTNKITNDNYSLSLLYNEGMDASNNPTGSSTEFNMYKYNDNISNMWSCNIPGDMTKYISFILRPSGASSDQTTYQFTYSSKVSGQTTYDRGANRMYVAESALGSPQVSGNNKTHKGYWVAVGDSDGAGNDGGELDGDDF